MGAKYIKVNRKKQQSPKTQKKKHQKTKTKHLKKTPNRQTLQTCRNIKKKKKKKRNRKQ